MTTSISMYDKYDSTPGSESEDVNWKQSDNPSEEYYFYPVIRPSSPLELSCSNQKYNYFKLVDISLAEYAEIIICSPYVTAATGHTDENGKVYLDYGGSGHTGNVALISSTGANVGTGVVDSNTGAVRAINMQPGLKNLTFKSTGALLTDQPGATDKRASEFRVFYKLSSSFSTPSHALDYSMNYCGIGNVTIRVPLLSSPEAPYTNADLYRTYSGAELYTPYIMTQLRVSAAEWDDVGNTPQYKILFKCKLYD